MIDFYPTFNTISLQGIDVLYDELLEAISKGAPLKVKIDASSSYAGNVFWPNVFLILFKKRKSCEEINTIHIGYGDDFDVNGCNGGNGSRRAEDRLQPGGAAANV